MSPWFEYDLEVIEELFYPDSGNSTNDPSGLPDLPGLYLVYANSYDCNGKMNFDCNRKLIDPTHEVIRKLAYVGVSTTSLKKRWKTHHLLPLLRFIESFGGVDFNILHWAFLPDLISPEMLKQWEADLIKRFQPPLNGRLKCLVKSEFIFRV